nr:zinc ribbon domain-containing protein [Stanieria cyanosphaera]
MTDASRSFFRQWLEYFANVFQRELVTVNPNYTSQDCSSCGKRVKKSLSTRTHSCECGVNLCRDHNAAINILNKKFGHGLISLILTSASAPLHRNSLFKN